ncbi:hypothetical protein E2C01_029614 [Portunus trituberculatus]|uniref:Uncharacterized protein n=1 Tax=Portunus trituberculatus TaxID=210409 RepID=A0A5B7ESK2_PORTR|nr:hypothetical protein [Portunus trituberculatus]
MCYEGVKGRHYHGPGVNGLAWTPAPVNAALVGRECGTCGGCVPVLVQRSTCPSLHPHALSSGEERPGYPPQASSFDISAPSSPPLRSFIKFPRKVSTTPVILSFQRVSGIKHFETRGMRQIDPVSESGHFSTSPPDGSLFYNTDVVYNRRVSAQKPLTATL